MKSRSSYLRALTQRGVGIVESMVAMLVLSIGLLGVAGLFVESVKSGRTALIRTQAVSLVNDMGDRIRANRTARARREVVAGAANALQGCVVTNSCTDLQLAEDDLARWVASAQAQLPRDAAGNPATTTIVFTPGASLRDPDRYLITLSWTEPGEPAAFTYGANVEVLPNELL
jgi:type IV pilus assembly protein PilV